METIVYDYGNVIEFYIQSIFKSGMLLNEHDELLSQFWRLPTFKTTKSTKTYLINTSLLTGVVGIYKKSILLTTISILPLGIELYRLILKNYRCKLYKRQFSFFINLLQEIFALVKKIMQYYQMRKVAINNLSENTRILIEDLILTRMFNYLLDIGKILFELILFLKNMLKEIGNIVDIGELNFIFHIDLNQENFTIKNTSEESVLSNYDKIQMAYIYVVSTFLCGIGLSLCVREWNSRNIKFTLLFSLILPQCLKYSEHAYGKIKESFAVLCNTLEKDTYENIPKSIDKPILNTASNLRNHLQISFNIITAMSHQLMSCNDTFLIRTYLEDLEMLFAQCNDILKVLQYQMYKVPTAEIEPVRSVENTECEKEIETITVKYSDTNENFQDEEFNLSVHGSDYSDESETSNLEYEQLLEYVKAQKLMIKELNDELKRRNIIKQNDVIPIPAKRTHITKQELNKTTPPLPPIPPPMLVENISANTSKSPTFTHQETDKNTTSNVISLESKNDFLAQIRAAATSRGVKETLFGDDIISSDESSEECYFLDDNK